MIIHFSFIHRKFSFLLFFCKFISIKDNFVFFFLAKIYCILSSLEGQLKQQTFYFVQKKNQIYQKEKKTAIIAPSLSKIIKKKKESNR